MHAGRFIDIRNAIIKMTELDEINIALCPNLSKANPKNGLKPAEHQ